jgi:hypothetical protein
MILKLEMEPVKLHWEVLVVNSLLVLTATLKDPLRVISRPFLRMAMVTAMEMVLVLLLITATATVMVMATAGAGHFRR